MPSLAFAALHRFSSRLGFALRRLKQELPEDDTLHSQLVPVSVLLRSVSVRPRPEHHRAAEYHEAVYNTKPQDIRQAMDIMGTMNITDPRTITQLSSITKQFRIPKLQNRWQPLDMMELVTTTKQSRAANPTDFGSLELPTLSPPWMQWLQTVSTGRTSSQSLIAFSKICGDDARSSRT